MPEIADINLKAAVKDIDAVFGNGYAKANPSLVAAYLQAAALREIDRTLATTAESVIDIGSKFRLF